MLFCSLTNKQKVGFSQRQQTDQADAHTRPTAPLRRRRLRPKHKQKKIQRQTRIKGNKKKKKKKKTDSLLHRQTNAKHIEKKITERTSKKKKKKKKKILPAASGVGADNARTALCGVVCDESMTSNVPCVFSSILRKKRFRTEYFDRQVGEEIYSDRFSLW
jgi:hypothetical protein